MNYYQCGSCGHTYGLPGNLAGAKCDCGGHLHATKAPRYRQEPDAVVRGARIFFGLVAALVAILCVLTALALGWRLPDWQLPCPKQDQEQTP